MGYRHKKEGALSLLPFLIFIVIYLGAGIYFQIHGVEMAFYQFPSVTAMFIAVLSAFFMGDETLQVKFGIFSRGAGKDVNHDHAHDLHPCRCIFRRGSRYGRP